VPFLGYPVYAEHTFVACSGYWLGIIYLSLFYGIYKYVTFLTVSCCTKGLSRLPKLTLLNMLLCFVACLVRKLQLLQSIIVKAIWYSYLPRSFSTLDELREDCEFVMNNCFSQLGTTLTKSSIAFCQNLKIWTIGQPNLRKRTHDLTLPMDHGW